MARLGRAYPVKRLVAKPATVVIRSVTVGSDTGLTASVSATTPADTQVGDVLLIFHVNDFYLASNMPAPTVSPGSPTANLVTNGTADAGSNLGHIKTYTAVVNTDGAQTVSVTETGTHDEEKALVVLVLAGADQATPIDIAANSSGASATTQVAPSVTTTNINDLLVIMVGSGGGSAAASYTTPVPLTEQTEIHVGVGLSGVLATEQIRAAGATGTFSFTAATAVPWDVVTVTVHPGTVAPAVPATNTPQPIVAGAEPFVPVPIPAVFITDVNAPAATVAATSSPQPLVVTPETLPPVVPTAFIAASQPLGNPAIGTDSALVVGLPFVWCPTPPVKLSSATVLGNPAVGTDSALVVTPPPFQPTPTPPVALSASQPLGNPAVGTGSALVVTSESVVAHVLGAKIFGPGAPATVVIAVPTAQPLVVSTPWQATVSPVSITASQPLGNPAVGTESPTIVTPIPGVPPVYPAQVSASEPLGNPAVGTSSPLVVTPPTPLVLVPPVAITASQPLGNPAVGTNAAMVVTPPTPIVSVPRAVVLGPGVPAVVTTSGTKPLVVSTPFTAGVPGALIASSQPLGNPAVSSPQPLVVSTPWISRVPGALLSANAAVPVISTIATPTAHVVSPPFTWCPTPPVSITASRPLGNPATGTPATVDVLIVTPPFAPVPIPPVSVMVSQPLGRPAVGTAIAAQVVTPPYVPVPIPPVSITASQPLGNPAVGTESALVVSPTPNWISVSPPLIVSLTAVATTPNALVVSPAFTLLPVPGAVVFATPAPVAVSAIRGSVPLVVTPNPGPGSVPKAIVFAPAAVAVTPNALLTTPPFTAIPVPGAQLTASQPLGRPAVGTRSAMVVGPQFVWTKVHITKLPTPQQPPSAYTGALDSTMGGSSMDGIGGGIAVLDQTMSESTIDGRSAVSGGIDGGSAATGLIG